MMLLSLYVAVLKTGLNKTGKPTGHWFDLIEPAKPINQENDTRNIFYTLCMQHILYVQ